MKSYSCTATMVTYLTTTVEATDLDSARKLADEVASWGGWDEHTEESHIEVTDIEEEV